MTFHYDILPEPKDRLEMILFAGPLQARMQTFLSAVLSGREMTPEEVDMADRLCYATAGVDYSRRQEADDWRICKKLMHITEAGTTGRAAMERLKAEFDEKTEEELFEAFDRFQKRVDKTDNTTENRARTA